MKKIIVCFFLLCGTITVLSMIEETSDEGDYIETFYDEISRDTSDEDTSPKKLEIIKIKLKQAVDMAVFVNNKVKSLCSSYPDRRDKQIRQLFDKKLVLSKRGYLIYDKKEKVLSYPTAITDIQLQFDIADKFKRPGDNFYEIYENLLKEGRGDSPKRYQEVAKIALVKLMNSKYTNMRKKLVRKSQSPRRVFLDDFLSKYGINRDTSTTEFSINMGGQNDDILSDSEPQINVKELVKELKEQLFDRNPRNSNDSNNEMKNLANLTHMLVENHKEQKRQDQYGELFKELRMLRTLPQETIQNTHDTTQKVNQNTNKNWKTMIIGFFSTVIIPSIINYITITSTISSSTVNNGTIV